MKDLKIQKLTEEFAYDVFLIEKDLLGSASYENIKKTLSSETLEYFLLFDNDCLIGFFEMSVIAPEAELFDIAVKKEYQGQGYANVLMQEFLNQVRLKKCDTVFLEVNKINYKAIGLYEKFGFVQYDIRKNYYGENDAVLMKLDLF